MRIKHNSANILGELHKYATHIPSTSPESSGGRIGDLEAPISIINLLSTSDAIQHELPFLLSRGNEPMDALFAYELELPKPLPTPPPHSHIRAHATSTTAGGGGGGGGFRSGSGSGTGGKGGRQRKPPKVKRDRKAEAERRKQRMLDAASGFRGPPRTRNAHARAEAFEAEARAGAEAQGGAQARINANDNANGNVIGDRDRGHAAASTSEHDDGNTTFDSEGKPISNGRRWKRPSIVQPGQVAVPPVVEDVDTQDSFSMFDRGWILPTGTRRGNRAWVERGPGPPPRKKSRSGMY